MSGENQNIAVMAELASKEIFEVFGWRQVGPKNKNWACVEHDKHDRKSTNEREHGNWGENGDFLSSKVRDTALSPSFILKAFFGMATASKGRISLGS